MDDSKFTKSKNADMAFNEFRGVDLSRQKSAINDYKIGIWATEKTNLNDDAFAFW